MSDKLPKKGTVERIKMDAFFGGVCVSLGAAFHLGSGTETDYLEVVGSVGPRDLLGYAIRERDSELPKIRRAVRWLESTP